MNQFILFFNSRSSASGTAAQLDDCTVRQAVDHMVNHDVGRLPVIHRSTPSHLVGIVTRSDVLSVFRRRAKDAELQQPLWRHCPEQENGSKPTANGGKPAKTQTSVEKQH